MKKISGCTTCPGFDEHEGSDVLVLFGVASNTIKKCIRMGFFEKRSERSNIFLVYQLIGKLSYSL